MDTALDAWRQASLPRLKQAWDAQAAGIADGRDRSAASRKTLGSKTKEFRSMDAAERATSAAFGPLLKAYQEEVDALTTRAKFAEQAFVETYKALGDAPDPVEALTACEQALRGGLEGEQRQQQAAAAAAAQAAAMEQLELENQKLQLELSEFRRDFQDVRNQEVTVRRLEEALAAAEARAEASIATATADIEARSRADQSRIEDMLNEQLQEQTRLADKHQQEAVASQRQLELVRTELAAARAANDERQAGSIRENDMLRNECETYRERILSLEREREEMFAAGGSKPADAQADRDAAAQLELALVQKDIEISRLHDEMEAHRQQQAQVGGAREALRKVQQQLDARSAEVADLKRVLEEAPKQAVVDDLRQQLKILQSVEFTEKELQAEDDDLEGADADDDVGGDDDTASVTTTRTTSSGATDKSNIAAMYREKCKRLESQSTSLRVKVSELQKAKGEVDAQLALAEEQRERLESLVHQLENDVEQAQLNTSRTGTDTPPPEREGDQGAGSLFQIVSSQRDRFKARVRELETAQAELHRTADEATATADSLRSDNLKLYEKIRFLQSYGAKGLQGNPGVPGKADAVEVRYKSEYEQQVDPFAAFSRKERRERIDSLPVAERVLLRATDIFMQTRFSRYFLVVYALMLHVVVFLTLYRTAHAQACDPDVLYAAQLQGQIQQQLIQRADVPTPTAE